VKWRIEIRPGDTVPRGYGVAYRIFDRDLAACYPLGVNALVCWARAALRWLRFPPGRYMGADEIIAAEQRGYERGRHDAARRVGEAYQDGWDAALAHLESLVGGRPRAPLDTAPACVYPDCGCFPGAQYGGPCTMGRQAPVRP
jgi:hypothetical protein